MGLLKHKIWIAIGLFVTLAIILIMLLTIAELTAPKNSNEITIGAVLSLSGPSAVWGESAQNGMELALENHPEIKVIYEDSKGNAADGVTAYQKLKLENPDMFISALSTISVPLASIAKEDKKVLLITQSAANNITNEYTFRYYTDANHFALPSFESDISPLKNATKLAVLYRSDEYAISVANKIQELSKEQGKEIVFMESYAQNETEFSTVLLKAKETNPDAFLFIPTPPSESLNILNAVKELNFNIPIVEVSNVQSDPETQSKAPNITFYTNQFAFSTPGVSEDFKTRYKAKYNKEPNFVAAFGYDMINLIATCQKDNIKECLENKKEVSGVTGTATNITNNDIVIPMDIVRVN